jgi:hypothetical protein
MNNPDLNPETRISQVKLVGAYLMQGHSITPIEALNLFGCMRLSAVIYNLKERGYKIQSQIITVPSGKRVSEYWINEEDRCLTK